MDKTLATILAVIAIGIWAGPVYTAVSGEVLMNVQNPSVSGTVLAPVRLKDGGSIGDNITAGIMPTGLMMHDGTNWDKVTGTTANGIDVDVTRITGTLTMTGNITPSDAFANPATAVNGNSLLSGFNGTTWDRLRSEGTNADGDAVLTLGALATEAYNKVFNGTTWDRLRSGVITGSALTDNSSNAFSNITTNTSTVVKASAGVVNRINVNVVGTTSNVRLYNDATAPCDTNFVMQLDTSALSSSTNINHTFTTGICALTAGAAAADISALYR